MLGEGGKGNGARRRGLPGSGSEPGTSCRCHASQAVEPLLSAPAPGFWLQMKGKGDANSTVPGGLLPNLRGTLCSGQQNKEGISYRLRGFL